MTSALRRTIALSVREQFRVPTGGDGRVKLLRILRYGGRLSQGRRAILGTSGARDRRRARHWPGHGGAAGMRRGRHHVSPTLMARRSRARRAPLRRRIDHRPWRPRGRRVDVKALVEATERRYGRLDILVNNGGIAGPIAPLELVNEAAWDVTLAADLAAFSCAARPPSPACALEATAASSTSPQSRAKRATRRWSLTPPPRRASSPDEYAGEGDHTAGSTRTRLHPASVLDTPMVATAARPGALDSRAQPVRPQRPPGGRSAALICWLASDRGELHDRPMLLT